MKSLHMHNLLITFSEITRNFFHVLYGRKFMACFFYYVYGKANHTLPIVYVCVGAFFFFFFCRVWSFSGEGHYMGDEMATWFSQFLGKEGLRVYYMSPRHKPRRLQDDPRWVDMTTWKDEVGMELPIKWQEETTPLYERRLPMS